MEVSWKSLCMQANSKLYSKRVNSYEFSNGRVFTEPADAVYGAIDLYPSSLLVPEEDLVPDGED